MVMVDVPLPRTSSTMSWVMIQVPSTISVPHRSPVQRLSSPLTSVLEKVHPASPLAATPDGALGGAAESVPIGASALVDTWSVVVVDSEVSFVGDELEQAAIDARATMITAVRRDIELARVMARELTRSLGIWVQKTTPGVRSQTQIAEGKECSTQGSVARKEAMRPRACIADSSS